MKTKTKLISLGNKYLEIEYGNPRFLLIKGTDEKIERIENDKIVELKYTSNYNIALNNILYLTDNDYFKIRKIEKDIKLNKYFLISHELTKSSTFILPLLFNNNEVCWDSSFCNCYIGNAITGEVEDGIYLLHRYYNDISYHSMIEKYSNSELLKEEINIDKYHTLFKFDIPKEFNNDYKLLIQSKYSRISEYAKEKILNFNYKGVQSERFKDLTDILTRGEALRKKLETKFNCKIENSWELHDKFNIDNEMFTEDLIVKESINQLSSEY